MDINFLEETKRNMKEIGKTEYDIIFIGILEGGEYCTWDEFCLMANREYYRGYGASCVKEELVIIFNDGAQLHRHEYNGSEWWEEIPGVDKYKCLSKLDTLFTEDWVNN